MVSKQMDAGQHVDVLMIPQIVYTVNDVYSASDTATSVIVPVHQYTLHSS